MEYKRTQRRSSVLTIWQNASKNAFLLTQAFWRGRQISAKMVSGKVWVVFSKKCAQIECMLKHSMLKLIIKKEELRIDICTLQNQGFLLVFAHFSALDFGKRSVENPSTQRGVLANTTWSVGECSLLRWPIQRAEGRFPTFFVVCNNSKKKANQVVCFLFV